MKTQLSGLDLEVLNPIETKKIIGGNWYDYHDIPEVVIPWDGGGGNDGGWWGNDPWYPDNGGGDYGGGSGSGPGNGSGDSFPDHICKQGTNANTCAANALSYAAGHFGATGLTASDFAEMAGKDFSNMAYNNGPGLNGGDLSDIVMNVFDNNVIGFGISDIITATSAGNPVIGIIENPGGNDGHVVVIVGANANGTVSFMDSMTGSMTTANMSNINFVGNFVQLTGVKDNALVNHYKNDTNDASACSICGR
ncbi:C39 family peptidase [Chryseobacterium sp. SSA4.19]|uniref:C39 family peptidase n=1 Tax=Chryseobacterium sp. SSA4.19 TaxID=2919915 RepID=UPI001F4E23FA|nr:C39 family peptidase [Chryseobacterium sp. SSA4.19]MCJ8153288.1 C39 family peptidase [Chryseobacterium sp. SSA4.19]